MSSTIGFGLPVMTIVVAVAAILLLSILVGWLVVAGLRALRTFVRSFWPHS